VIARLQQPLSGVEISAWLADQYDQVDNIKPHASVIRDLYIDSRELGSKYTTLSVAEKEYLSLTVIASP